MYNKIYSKIPFDISRPNWLSDSQRDPKKIWLDKNENTDEDLAKYIKNILINIKYSYFNTYPDLKKLYIKLSKNIAISPKKILLTNGSDGGIRSVFESFVNPNDLILRTEPTFAMYSIYSKIYKAKEILLKYNTNYSLDINFIIETLRLKKPKLLCLPNPDSPTGQIIVQKSIDQILNVALKSRTFVLLDEAYYEYYKKTNIYNVNKYKNLIITRTAGKAYGLSGARIGYLVANEAIIQKLHQTKPMYEVNYIGAELFYMLLKKKNNKFVEKIIKQHLASKKYFELELKKLNFHFVKTYSNFVIVDFGLKTRNILLHLKKICYFRYFKEGLLKGKVRFSLTNMTNFIKIIKVIKKVI
jgi:histidinol-phosphate aminotransferase